MVVSGCLVIQKTGKVHGADWHGKIVTFYYMELQRQLATKTDVIMDGRDIGTCVLPDALQDSQDSPAG